MNDVELLETLRTHPDAGLRLLVGKYEGLLFSVARGVLRQAPEADVEECVADVISEFYFALGRLDETMDVKAYLCAAVKNKALNVLRGSVRHRTDDLDGECERASGEMTPEEQYIESEWRAELACRVRDLGQPDCEIIFRKYYLCESSLAIAEALGMSERNVNVRTHRALKKLKKCLENG